MTQRYDGDTPSESDNMRLAAENAVKNFFAALPAKILSFDVATQCADVQPIIKAVDADGNARTIPPIKCCPVWFPAGAGFSIAWDLQPGDPCLLVFSSRSIAQWSSGNGSDDDARPESARVGSLTDAIVLPGLRAAGDALAALEVGALHIGLDDGTVGIKLEATGAVTITGASVAINGGSQLVASANAIQTELADIQVKMAAIGGAYIAPVTPGAIAVSDLTSD